MTSQSSLNEIREQLQKAETAFERINKQSSPQLIDIDTFLGHLRELYDMGYELKAHYQSAASFEDTESNSGEKIHHEAIADKPVNEDPPEHGATFEDVPSGSEPSAHEEPSKEESSRANKDDDDKTENTADDDLASTSQNSNEGSKDLTDTADQEQQVTKEESFNQKESEPEFNAEKDEVTDKTEASPESDNNEAQPKGPNHQAINQRKDNPKPLYEKFTGQQTALHEKLQERNKGQSLADKFQDAPIYDLKSAIGLNERAAFVNELFNGNKTAFHETVSHVNNASDYDEAIAYLDQSIKYHYQWDEDSETVAHFLELVYRRFMNKS